MTHAGRWVAISLLALGAALVLGAGVALADVEPNDDMESAEAIAAGTHPGRLSLAGDGDDWFSFSIVPGQAIHLEFSAHTAEVPMECALVGRGDAVAVDQVVLSSMEGRTDTGSLVTANETATLEWYLHVSCTDEGGDYELTLRLEDPDDAGTGRDAGNDTAGALTIEPGTTVAGHLEGRDQKDYYRFRAGEGDVARVDFESNTTTDPLFLSLGGMEQLSGCYWAVTLDDLDREGASASLTTSRENGTDWMYVRVVMEAEAGDYRFELTVDRQDDAGTGGDACGDVQCAEEIEAGSTVHGRVADLDRTDRYKFRAGPGDVVVVEFVSHTEGEPLYMDINDSYEWSVTLDDLGERGATARRVTSPNLPARPHEWYHIAVRWRDVGGDYEFNLSVEPQDDAGTGGDAPGDPSGAAPIAPGEHTGLLGDADTADSYRLELRRAWVVDIGLTVRGDEPCTLRLTDGPDGAVLGTVSSQGGTPASHTWEVPDGPTFAVDCFLTIEGDIHGGDEEERGVYTLTVAIDKGANPPDDSLPVIGPEPTVRAKEGKDMRLRVTITDDIKVARAVLHYRVGEGGNWSSVAMTQDGEEWSASVPKAGVGKAKKVYYYVEAEDMWGNQVSHGTEVSPMSVKVEAADGDDGPAFGPLLAVAALVVALVVASRRRG